MVGVAFMLSLTPINIDKNEKGQDFSWRKSPAPLYVPYQWDCVVST